MSVTQEETSVHQRFLENLDEYRDFSTWGNFTENFKLSFTHKVLPIDEQPQWKKMYEVETKYLRELVNTLSEGEIIEWEEAAKGFVRKNLKRVAVSHWDRDSPLSEEQIGEWKKSVIRHFPPDEQFSFEDCREKQ